MINNCRQWMSVRVLTFILIALISFPATAFGATKTVRKKPARSKKAAVTRKTTAHTAARAASKRPALKARRPSPRRKTPVRKVHFKPNTMAHFLTAKVAGGPWTVPTHADSTVGDYIDGEDLVVRRAAVEALGGYNGAVVAVNADTGRILTMVNQKVALGQGYQPCSTIKVPVSLAALNEGLVTRTTPITLYGRTRMAMTEALAKSNNHYFANLGVRMGFDRFSYYAKLFGYGEKAGLEIPGEHPGHFPAQAPINGGVGMLTSFGETIRQTPLQLAAFMAAVANGGTLYYLQYPRSLQEAGMLVPRVKRQLDIRQHIPDVLPGMLGAVMFGTARRAGGEDMVAGKTGTCTDGNTHLGWFGAFNNSGEKKLVVVVMLTGGRGISGGTAAGVAGELYRRLSEEKYFEQRIPLTPAALIFNPLSTN
jgi:beta-lactamase class D